MSTAELEAHVEVLEDRLCRLHACLVVLVQAIANGTVGQVACDVLKGLEREETPRLRPV